MRPSRDPQKTLGIVLRELRGERKATQRAVARKAKLTFADYCAIECGHTNPTWGTMRRIAAAFGVSITELAKREEALNVE